MFASRQNWLSFKMGSSFYTSKTRLNLYYNAYYLSLPGWAKRSTQWRRTAVIGTRNPSVRPIPYTQWMALCLRVLCLQNLVSFWESSFHPQWSFRRLRKSNPVTWIQLARSFATTCFQLREWLATLATGANLCWARFMEQFLKILIRNLSNPACFNFIHLNDQRKLVYLVNLPSSKLMKCLIITAQTQFLLLIKRFWKMDCLSFLSQRVRFWWWRLLIML